MIQVPWDQQVKPELGVDLDFSNPLYQNLTGLWLLNEGGGIKVQNLAPTDRHGELATITGATWNENGEFGKCLDNDGSGDYVTMPGTIGTYLDAGAFTISVWGIWPVGTATPANTVSWASAALVGETNDLLAIGGMDDTGGTDSILFYGWDGTEEHFFAPITKGVWQNYHMTSDGTTLRGYAQGLEVGSEPIDGDIAMTGTLELGRAAQNTDCWVGQMDLLKTWNRVLTPQEILEDHLTPFGFVVDQLIPGFVLPAGGDGTISARSIQWHWFTEESAGGLIVMLLVLHYCGGMLNA